MTHNPAADASGGGRRGPFDWDRLGVQARDGARRFWPILGLIGYVAYFDWKAQGQLLFLMIFGGLAVAPVLFPAIRAQFTSLASLLPSRFRGPIMAGVPVAALYLGRWKGTQGELLAILTIVAPLGLALVVAANRPVIDSLLTPFYELRNRYVPRGVRIGLMFVLPMVITFAVAHQSLGDIFALFGGETSNPRSPAGTSNGIWVMVSALLSVCAVFLLVNEPRRQPMGQQS